MKYKLSVLYVQFLLVSIHQLTSCCELKIIFTVEKAAYSTQQDTHIKGKDARWSLISTISYLLFFKNNLHYFVSTVL